MTCPHCFGQGRELLRITALDWPGQPEYILTDRPCTACTTTTGRHRDRNTKAR